MAVVSDFLDSIVVSCVVFTSLITIGLFVGKCCNRKHRFSSETVNNDSKDSKETNADSSSDVADSEPIDVYTITGQERLRSPIECHMQPILYEPGRDQTQMALESSLDYRAKGRTIRNQSPLRRIDEEMENEHLHISDSGSVSKACSNEGLYYRSFVNTLELIKENEPTTTDGTSKESSCLGMSNNRVEKEEEKEEQQDQNVTTQNNSPTSSQAVRHKRWFSSKAPSVTDRESTTSVTTYESIKTSTEYGYESLHSRDSGVSSRNSQSNHYEWCIQRYSESSSEQITGQRRSYSTEHETQQDEGSSDPNYNSLCPRYCKTLQLDATYESLQEKKYPATISTTNPITLSEQLQKFMKTLASPKRNTVLA